MPEPKNQRILIVEDDVIAQMTLNQMLNEMGYQNVRVASNAEDALTLLNKETVQLILMDVFISGNQTGIELAAKVNQLYDIGIIYLTASSDPTTFELITQTKHLGILEKPYDYEKIEAKINSVIATNESEDVTPSILEEESLGILDLIFNTADVGICVTDRNRKFVRVNDAYCKLYGYRHEELVGQDFTMVLPEEQRAYASKLHDDYIAVRTEESAGEWQVMVRDGSLMDIWVTVGRFFAKDGSAFKVTTVTDITERKKYIKKLEEEISRNEGLIQEIHHRVKNNLNTISGLLYLRERAYKDDELKSSIKAIRNRIQILALVHHKFFDGDNLEFLSSVDFFEELIENLRKSHDQSQNVKITQDIEEFNLGNEEAVTLGLILNELLSNVFKHAFFETVQNKAIKISIESTDTYFELEVTDNGKGMLEVEMEKEEALGLKLVKNLLVNGKILISDPPGTSITIRLPVNSGH